MNRSRIRIINGLIAVTQAGLTMVISMAVSMGLAKLCMNWFGWGDWCMVVGIIVGALAGVYGMFSYLYAFIKMDDGK